MPPPTDYYSGGTRFAGRGCDNDSTGSFDNNNNDLLGYGCSRKRAQPSGFECGRGGEVQPGTGGHFYSNSSSKQTSNVSFISNFFFQFFHIL